MAQDADLTILLKEWIGGDNSALDRLTTLVYPELHALANSFLARHYRPNTLQATAVVNELFLKLLAHRPARLESRKHFYVLAAKLIRAALVDHYRQAHAGKRGGDLQRVPLHDELLWINTNGSEMLSCEQALTELEEIDPQQAALFGMRYFLGCTADEAAELTGLSKATVDRKVKVARAWLYQRLRAEKLSPTS